jgi:hypothetical protein
MRRTGPSGGSHDVAEVLVHLDLEGLLGIGQRGRRGQRDLLQVILLRRVQLDQDFFAFTSSR